MSSFFSNVDISESLVLLHLCGSVSPGKWGWRWDSLHMRSVRQRPMHTACVDTTGEPNMCSWPWLPPSAAGIFMALLNSRRLSRGGGVSWKAWQAVFWECLVRTFPMSTEKFGGLLGSTAGMVSVSCQNGN